jgi:hypothetical protein
MKKVQDSHSQAGQESFVMNMLGWKTHGFYVEVGAYHPVTLSNTYRLETDYSWGGISFEIDRGRADEFNKNRVNHCVIDNATTCDYKKYLNDIEAPRQIDYLQLDIEPAINTYKALCGIPFDDYRFSVITFEHDLYNDDKNTQIRQDSRQMLYDNGYQLVVGDIKSAGYIFEDWYVDPTAVDESIWRPVIANDVDGSSLFE